jgi:hypothetical protein
MSTKNYIVRLLCIGLLVAPVAWAANTQLELILPYYDCQHQARLSAIVSIAALAAAVLAGAISWQSAGRANAVGRFPALTFLGWISALSAAVFAFALLMQGIASLVLSGCER